MKCSKCQTDAPPGAKFCVACGTRLRRTCGQCGHGAPPEASFCPECGARLAPRVTTPTAVEAASAEPAQSAASPASNAIAPQDAEFEERVRRIRQWEQRRSERRFRSRARGVAIAMTLAVVLIGVAWLAIPGRVAVEPIRVAGPPVRSAPVTDERNGRDNERRVSAPDSLTPGHARDVAATHSPAPAHTRDVVAMHSPAPAHTRDVVATVSQSERSPSPPLPGSAEAPASMKPPRSDTPSRPARATDRPLEAPASPGNRAKPEATLPPAPAAMIGPDTSDKREVSVRIATERLGDDHTAYTVQLHERDGQPVTDATVSIRGRRTDGVLVEATLVRTAEPGTYRAVIWRRRDITDTSLRIASVGRVQEVVLE